MVNLKKLGSATAAALLLVTRQRGDEPGLSHGGAL